ncbi:MAG: hypothetical protein AAF743_04200, partial [Planctomycetota bacterium]
MSYRLPHIFALALPLVGGVVLFGWRGAVVITVVVGSALGAGALLKRGGRRGRHMELIDVAWAAIGVCLLLPAALGTVHGLPWAVGVGVVSALCVWGFGGPAVSRVPIASVIVLLVGIVAPAQLEQ